MKDQRGFDRETLQAMAGHAAAAAAFFFTLQFAVFGAGLSTSLVWAGVTAVAAAWLAWQQQQR